MEHMIQYIAIGKILPLDVYYSTECHKKYKRLYRLSNMLLDETSSCDVCGTWYTCAHITLSRISMLLPYRTRHKRTRISLGTCEHRNLNKTRPAQYTSTNRCSIHCEFNTFNSAGFQESLFTVFFKINNTILLLL